MLSFTESSDRPAMIKNFRGDSLLWQITNLASKAPLRLVSLSDLAAATEEKFSFLKIRSECLISERTHFFHDFGLELEALGVVTR